LFALNVEKLILVIEGMADTTILQQRKQKHPSLHQSDGRCGNATTLHVGIAEAESI
jgi:hypothetical protein